VIFLPYEPGLFIALILPATDLEQLISDSQSVNSFTSNQVKLCKQKFAAKVFLDLASLPAKI
jgi:hypothetical protein